MKTKLELTPISTEELDRLIDDSPDSIALVVNTVNFIKGVEFGENETVLKPNIERLAVLVEVRHNMNGDYVWRLNRNTFRTLECGPMDDHLWRIEPRDAFGAYIVDDSKEYLQKMIALSMGCTYNLDTDEWNEPTYTWKITNK